MSNIIITNKKNCSTVLSSSCLNWSGYKLKSFDISSNNCQLNIDDIILNIDDLLYKINQSVNVDDLNKNCLLVEDTTKLSSYVKALIKDYCILKQEFNTLKSEFDNLDIFSKELNIDINCVTNSNNCGTGNVHKLSSLIKTLFDELCVIKNKIN